MLEEVRSAFGIARETGEPVTKGDFLRSIPLILTLGLLAGFAQSIGGDFRDGTLMGDATAVGVALLIMIPLGLLASRLLDGHPGMRRSIWVVLLAFVLTMNMDDSTVQAHTVKLAVMLGVAFALALTANRLSIGSWWPSRGRVWPGKKSVGQ